MLNEMLRGGQEDGAGPRRLGSALAHTVAATPMLPVLVIAVATLMMVAPGFLGAANLQNMAWLFGPLLISALGITFVFLVGGIDLSIGSTLSLATVATAWTMRETGLIWPGIAAGMAIGAAVGLINGLAVAVLRFPAFVHTFGMLLILRAFAMLWTGGASLGRLPIEVLRSGRGSLFGIPNLLLIGLATMLFAHILLTRLRLGRETFLVGANERAAIYNGLRVGWVKFAAYALCGLCSGLAGVTVVLRLGSGGPVLGDNVLLMAIAAVVLGGTSIMGGEGSAWKTLTGVAVIVLLDKGLNLIGLSFYDQAIVLGAVIIFGSALSQLVNARLVGGRKA
ncbi:MULTISPECIES: ABC transporter permease [Rhizobium]|nr:MULTISPECIES: ABC transporter permease [Rhizobium]